LPARRDEARRAARRDRAASAAFAVTAALAAIGACGFVRAARRDGARRAARAIVRPLAVATALYVGGAAAVLTALHGEADARPFLWLGLGVLAMDWVARAWRAGWVDERPGARALRAASCAAGVLAVAFLALAYTNAAYLASFGL
jgi:4-hydroxybenzoate polyprenyltransferase